jgi:hypothetical protein
MALINPFQAGFRLINGTHLNKIVTALNNLTGGTGTTPAPAVVTTLTANALVGGATPLPITGQAAASATAVGGTVAIAGAPGGATSGDGGAATLTGGAGTAGNGNGGSVVLTGGAKNGTGIPGGIRNESLVIQAQGAPAAKTVSATLTAAELLSGIITVTQGAGADSAQTVPTGTALQAGLPADFAIGDSFYVSIINLGGASETVTLTANTDITLVGRAVVNVAAATASGSGAFRFRKTADHVFVAYRIA